MENKMVICLKSVVVTIFFLTLSNFSIAQTFVFAQLNGTTNMNTTGWNLTGNAYTGDTGGDVDASPNELILTNASGNQSGGVFYGTAINPLICSKWTVEFDYRIWGGSAADGLAFCFLDVPPTGFVNGGGIGIPGTANGLKVILDTWNNCGGANPELQIFSGTGYNECSAGIVKLNNTNGNLNFVRNNSYQPVKITYFNGLVTLFINNQQYLTANFPINFTGYMGFTASTGGSSDQHSIKNVIIYTDQASSNAGADDFFCENNTGQIGTNSNPNYIYSWSPTLGLSSSTVANPTVTLSNNSNSIITQTYTVTTSLASNPGVCPTTDQVTVSIYPDFTTNLSSNICLGDSLFFNSSYIKNEGIYTAPLSSLYGCDSIVNLSLTVIDTQTVYVDTSICFGNSILIGSQQFSTSGQFSVVLQNVNGCDSTIQLNLTVHPVPILICEPDTICEGDTASLNPTGALNYSWNPNLGLWDQNGNYLLVPSVSENLLLTGTDLFGCSSSIQVPVIVNPLPIVQLSSSSSQYCFGDTIILNATGANIYEWSEFLSSNASQQTFQAIEDKVYNILGFDLNGCQNKDSIQIVVNSLPQLTVTPDQEICQGDAVNLTVSGATNYIWNPSGSGNNYLVSPTQTTTYQIEGYNAFGCSSSISTTVVVHSNPIAILNSYPLVTTADSPNITFNNNSIGAIESYLNFGDGSSTDFFEEEIVHNYTSEAGEYIVTLSVINEFGCIDSVQEQIQIKGDEFFYVPNTFTPNGDEANQEFFPILSTGFDLTKYALEIYNRWGELIFRSQNLDKGWDGNFNGKNAPDGIYTWKIYLKDINTDLLRVESGYVNLLR